MITIKYKNNDYIHNVFHLVKAFFPEEEIIQQIDEEQEPQLQLILNGGSCFSLVDSDCCFTRCPSCKLEMNTRVYAFLAEHTNKTLPWGILTGVRPTKLATRLLEQEIEPKSAYAPEQKVKQKAPCIIQEKTLVQNLCEKYLLSREKAKLALDIAKREKELLEPLDLKEGFSLYVGIPFCPSICSYCSFGSGELDKWKDRVDEYVDVLCKEIVDLGRAIKRSPNELETLINLERGIESENSNVTEVKLKYLNAIYIGGGTPTTLNVNQLSRLLHTIRTSFAMDKLVEYTLEAGRPETITREKLRLLKSHGVTRISINPQSMNQKTLDKVGRKHTVEDVVKAFHLAREEGFDNINMDLIIGLPDEGINQVKSSLRQIKQLNPDSLTIHTLAIKRGAKFAGEQRWNFSDKRMEQAHVGEILNLCYESAVEMDLHPYYLYRQKNIAGNFENVGFAKVDKAGIYNILIIEELQSIFGVGVGATTKLVKNSKIRRLPNTKDIKKYLESKQDVIMQ